MQQLLNPKRELQQPSWQASLDADKLNKDTTYRPALGLQAQSAVPFNPQPSKIQEEGAFCRRYTQTPASFDPCFLRPVISKVKPSLLSTSLLARGVDPSPCRGLWRNVDC